MNWAEVFTIIGVLGAFIFWIYTKLDTDMKSLDSEMKAWMRHSTSRTDQLYQMFIDLLKDRK